MIDAATLPRAFMVFPNATVEEVLDDGTNYWVSPGNRELYEALVLAGYPLTSDEDKNWDAIVDLRTDGTTVLVFTASPAGEHVMPPEVAEVFLSWYRRNAEEEG